MLDSLIMWAAIVAMNTPVIGIVENRPSDEWVVLEVLVGPELEPRYIDYQVSKFPCSAQEGQKFHGALRPNGQLMITKCVDYAPECTEAK